MRIILIVCFTALFFASCMKTKVFRADDFKSEYRNTILNNYAVQKLIKDVASNSEKRAANVVFAEGFIIVRAYGCRMNKVEKFLNAFQDEKKK